MTLACGTLYICGTPIGNLEDTTFRVVRVLEEVDLIAAEDTRITRRLLHRHSLRTPVVSYHGYSTPGKLASLIEQLVSGKSIALVSSAGTPGISDPGVPLVNAAVERGITVTPIPGPSAVVAALSASGYPAQQFVFLGFLPRKATPRRDLLSRFEKTPETLVLYESPERIQDTLEEARRRWGNRRCAVFREMTKVFEEVVRGTLMEVLARLAEKKPRGEFTVVVEGNAGTGATEEAMDETAVTSWLESLPKPLPKTRDLATMLVDRARWSRNQSYRFIMQWRKRQEVE